MSELVLRPRGPRIGRHRIAHNFDNLIFIGRSGDRAMEQAKLARLQ